MSKCKPLIMIALFIAMLVPALAEDQSANKAAAANDAAADVRQDKGSNAASVAGPGYVIGPQDVLTINVWKEPELSAPSVPVRPDGKISMPLLNDIQAAGMTPMTLTASITEKLKKYLADPRVAVTVKEINSQRVYILGQVARPGAYPLVPQMTVLQALSTAGGFGQYASLKGIYVLRSEKGNQVKLPFNYKEVVKGNNAEQNVFLQPGDTVVVP